MSNMKRPDLKIRCVEGIADKRYSKFEIYPLEREYSLELSNFLERILYYSLPEQTRGAVNDLFTSKRKIRGSQYDKLILKIWTNGEITPSEVLFAASKQLYEYLGIISSLSEAVQKLQ